MARTVKGRSMCSVDGCDSFVVGRGLCNAHYRRMRRHGDPLAGNTVYGAVEAFLNEAIKSDTDKCILWPFGISNGYGTLRVEKFGQKYAHAYVCDKVHGPRPSRHHIVCHKPVVCHNRSCINPRHIRWDTYSANVQDAVIDGTAPHGERSGTAKLTATDVIEIRESADSSRELATRFGVTRNYVAEIRRGETVWRNV